MFFFLNRNKPPPVLLLGSLIWWTAENKWSFTVVKVSRLSMKMNPGVNQTCRCESASTEMQSNGFPKAYRSRHVFRSTSCFQLASLLRATQSQPLFLWRPNNMTLKPPPPHTPSFSTGVVHLCPSSLYCKQQRRRSDKRRRLNGLQENPANKMIWFPRGN